MKVILFYLLLLSLNSAWANSENSEITLNYSRLLSPSLGRASITLTCTKNLSCDLLEKIGQEEKRKVQFTIEEKEVSLLKKLVSNFRANKTENNEYFKFTWKTSQTSFSFSVNPNDHGEVNKAALIIQNVERYFKK